MATPKLNLPTITSNMTADIVRDLNALAESVDAKAGAASGLATLGADGKVPASQINVDLSALQTEINNKVDKVAGKALSTNDYTTAEKTKLAGIAAGAQPNAVTSVAGRTGAVTLTKTDVGLTNVDNVKQASKVEHDTLSRTVTMHMADYTSHIPYTTATRTGETNIYGATLGSFTDYYEGMAVSFKADRNNDANGSTITYLVINNKPGKVIKKSNGTNLSQNSIKAGGIYTVRYDGASFILQGEGGEYGNVTSNDVMLGKTFGTDEGIKTGTLVAYPAGSLLKPFQYRENIAIERHFVRNSNIDTMATDEQGNVYVAEYAGPGREVYKLKPGGAVEWTIVLTSAQGAVVDLVPNTDGGLYVLLNSGYILRYSVSGAFMWQNITYLNNGVTRAALDSAGNIYVASVNTAYLTKINPATGATIWAKSDQGAFQNIVIENDQLFLGSSSGRVYVLNTDGVNLRTITNGSTWIDSIALGSDNSLFIGTREDVVKYTREGVFQWTRAADFVENVGTRVSTLVSDFNGGVCCGLGNGFVRKFTSGGNMSLTIPATTQEYVVRKLAKDGEGNVFYATNRQVNKVKYDIEIVR